MTWNLAKAHREKQARESEERAQRGRDYWTLFAEQYPYLVELGFRDITLGNACTVLNELARRVIELENK